MNKEQLEEYHNFAKEKLGYEFNDINLLVTALTHRSYSNEHRNRNGQVPHNERLEFLGDAVLELVVSDYLYRNYHEPEGVMTAWRSALVRTESIGAAGEELGYGPLIRLSKGEQHGNNRAHASIMADCFEAVIGAIYLDRGYVTARDFIHKHIIIKAKDVIRDGTWRDPKSHLQEYAQKTENITPVYRTISQTGPDHDREYVVAVYIGDKRVGTGIGPSKSTAQANAAAEGVKWYLKQDIRLKKMRRKNTTVPKEI